VAHGVQRSWCHWCHWCHSGAWLVLACWNLIIGVQPRRHR
jgi:hypothetical protein